MREILNDLENVTETLDPEEKARAASRMPLPKRFYEKVTVNENNKDNECSFQVLLDGREVKTPARNALSLPTRKLAELVVNEFSMQEKVINPAKMPVTRLVNTVIDGIKDNAEPIFEDLLRFSGTDMLFYRADAPKELVERQQKQWDPILDWAATRFGAHFILSEGVMHVMQPQEALSAIKLHLRTVASPFALGALHSMTTLTGSTLLALAVAEGELNVDEAWRLAHLDEDWTNEQWGEDEEALKRRAYHGEEIVAAAAILSALHEK